MERFGRPGHAASCPGAAFRKGDITMKRLIAALMMASALAGLIGGCSALPDEAGSAEGSDSVNGTLEKAEQVEFRNGSGEVLRTLTTNDELNAFFETIDLGDDWEWVDEPEEEPVTELTASFLQTPTQTVFGKKVEEGDLVETARLTLYEGGNVAEVRLALFTFHVELPDETAQALREMAAA